MIQGAIFLGHQDDVINGLHTLRPGIWSASRQTLATTPKQRPAGQK
jgi:hypothetical protein